LGLDDVANVLSETLAEEKAADEKLTALAESGINDAATAGDSEDDEEEMDAKPAKKSESAAVSAQAGRARGGRR
jgi:hypothetical protein